MRRVAKWLARLYPSAWRARYGDEFDALLEDTNLRWRDLPNIFLGAVRMQRPNKVVAWFALAGLLIGAVLILQSPKRYVASGSAPMSAEFNPAEVLTRRALADLIEQNDLYYAQRRLLPMEDVVEGMRRDIKLSFKGESSIGLTYAYIEPERAQKTLASLLKLISEAPGTTGEVHREDRSLAPLLWGLSIGLAAGTAIAVCMRKGHAWTLRVAKAGVIGALLTLGTGYLIPNRYRSVAIFRADPELLQSLPSPKGLEIQRIGKSTVMLAFTSPDRLHSQAVLAEILRTLRVQSWEDNKPARFLKILDPPSLSQLPIYPNRLSIALIGLALGLLLGGLTSPARLAQT